MHETLVLESKKRLTIFVIILCRRFSTVSNNSFPRAKHIHKAFLIGFKNKHAENFWFSSNLITFLVDLTLLITKAAQNVQLDCKTVIIV